MLDPIAQLPKHLVGDVDRVLRHEVHAHSLRSDQAHHHLHLLHERGRRVGEEQVRLVEEEHELRLLEVPDLREILEQLREQPEEERGVEPRVHHQLVGRQHVDHALAVDGLHEVRDVQHRLAEELRASLVLELQQPALDRADARGRDVAILRLHLGGVIADELQHRAQVREIEQQQPVVVGRAESDAEHAFLGVVQRKET